MTRMARVSLVVWVLVSVILIGGGAFAKSADNLRRIVKFRGIDMTEPEGLATARSVVRGSESSEMHGLWLVNALAIRLPTAKAEQALASLQSHRDVEEVYNDSMSRADGAICIDPAPPLSPESYPWGLQTINVPAVHQHWPGLQGAGVMVTILDTGIDLGHPVLSPRIIVGYNACAGGYRTSMTTAMGRTWRGLSRRPRMAWGSLVWRHRPGATFGGMYPPRAGQQSPHARSSLYNGYLWPYSSQPDIRRVSPVRRALAADPRHR